MDQQSVNEILQRIDALGGVSSDAIRQALEYGTDYYFADGLAGVAIGICALIASVGCALVARLATKSGKHGDTAPIFMIISVGCILSGIVLIASSVPSITSPEWVAIQELLQAKP